MNLHGVLAAALLSVGACAAESTAAGKWNCANVSETGHTGQWTLLIRDDGKALTGALTDGEAELALSEIKLDGDALTFRFHVNGKPYTFDGKIAGRSLEGTYAGEEARGKLTCKKPSS